MFGNHLLALLSAADSGFDRNDLNFVLAGFGITVLPFLGFLLWTFVPMSDRRMVEWFAPFGRLLPSGIPLVRGRLVKVRWSRRIGATVGAVIAWAVSSWFGVRYQESVPGGIGWLPLVGYVLGAVLAELRALHLERGARRSAELRVRRVRDYVAPWFLLLGAVLAVSGIAASLAHAVFTTEFRADRESILGAVLRALGVAAVYAVALWCSRAMVRLPVQRRDGVDPYLDDAFRQLSIVTCLASSMLLSLMTTGTWLSSAVSANGWFAAPLVLSALALLLVLWGAIRHPFAATFGPRLRETLPTSGPTPPSSPAPPSAPAPSSAPSRRRAVDGSTLGPVRP